MCDNEEVCPICGESTCEGCPYIDDCADYVDEGFGGC